MRIVIPISSADAASLPLFLKVLKRQGTLFNHAVTFVPTASHVQAAQEAARQVREYCPDVSVEPMPIDPISGWPRACNAHFSFVLQLMMRKGGQTPWFWMELDCLPTKKGWADKLAMAYGKAGKPFVGRMVQTIFPNSLGGFGTMTGDSMLMGCAIYPPDTLRRCALWKDLGVTDVSAQEPFDRYLRHEMTREGMANTILIGNRWRTKNYKADLTCENADTGKNWDHSKNDVTGAVVIHGCKDDSLAELILSGALDLEMVRTEDPSEMIMHAEQKAFIENSTPADEPPSKLATLETKVDALASMFGQLMERISAGQAVGANAAPPNVRPAAPGSVAGEKETGGKHNIAPCGEGQTGLLPRAMTILGEGKKLMLSQLCKRLSTKPKLLMPLLESHGYTFEGPAKWVKLPSAA